jgi:chemotaxis protein CheC
MMADQIALTELERDALTELVNIGVSRAAAGLRKMVGGQVLLSVPSVEVVSHRTAAALIGERESDGLVAVRQDFTGAFSGRAMLIFPQANSMELIRAVAGEDLGAEDLAGLADEALAETGNVVLNGCLATMANMLQQSLTMSLPEVLRGDGVDLFRSQDAESGRTGDGAKDRRRNGGNDGGADVGVVLFLYINFSVHDRDIRGYIAMLMDLPSLTALQALIGDFIARVLGNDAA